MESLQRGFLQIASICALEPDMNVVKKWLSNTPESWALILDNADDVDLDLSPYFPVGNRGIILITTRNPGCTIHATVGSHKLGPMTPDEAVTLILKTTGVGTSHKSAREKAKPVVELLGYLPLAVVQAGALIREGQCRMEEYCAIYSQHRQKLLSQNAVQCGHEYQYTVYTTWDVSRKMIGEMTSQVGRDAIELLKIFSFLHHEGISESMFKYAHYFKRYKTTPGWMLSHQSDIVQRQTSQEWDPLPFRAALSLLLSFSLINRDNDYEISMHTLVHTWARDRLISSNDKTAWEQAIATVALSIGWDNNTNGYHHRRTLVPHIDACLDGQNDSIFDLHDAGTASLRIAENFAQVYHEVGRRQDALQLAERVANVEQTTLGEEHPHTMDSMAWLSIYCSDAGQREKALELRKKVMELRSRILGAEDLATLESICDLACGYHSMGDLVQALELLEPAVKAKERLLGKENPENLPSMLDLAFFYSNAGRDEEALQLIEHVVGVSMRTLGAANPDALAYIRSLADRCHGVGRREMLLPLATLANRGYADTLGESHPTTLRSSIDLVISLSRVGKERKALELAKKVTEDHEEFLGKEHPQTLASMHVLAITYAARDQDQKALQMVRTYLRYAFLSGIGLES